MVQIFTDSGWVFGYSLGMLFFVETSGNERNSPMRNAEVIRRLAQMGADGGLNKAGNPEKD